jgi:methylglutamate dehydrogenase subunit B
VRIACPFCGERGVEEFSYRGDAGVARPDGSGTAEAWTDYVYLRQNPAGPHREHWQHLWGCRAWLVVTRDTRSHAIAGVEAAGKAARGVAGTTSP